MKSTSSRTLKVRIQHDESTVEFEGDYEYVWASINRYLSEIYPSLPLAKKLIGAIDIETLANYLAGKVQISSGRISVITEGDAKKKILLCLAAAYLAKMLGMIENEAMTPKEVSIATGIEERVTRARLSEMRKQNLVMRTDEGRYAFLTSTLEKLMKED